MRVLMREFVCEIMHMFMCIIICMIMRIKSAFYDKMNKNGNILDNLCCL